MSNKPTKKDKSCCIYWLDPIKNKSEIFHRKTGYLLRYFGSPNFMLLSHNIRKINLIGSYKSYTEKKQNYDP